MLIDQNVCVVARSHALQSTFIIIYRRRRKMKHFNNDSDLIKNKRQNIENTNSVQDCRFQSPFTLTVFFPDNESE